MSQAINNMSVTWTSGATENGIKLNVTDPGATAASNLLDLQVGGASRFSVSKEGTVSFGAFPNPTLSFANNSVIRVGGSASYLFGILRFTLAANASLSWTSADTNPSGGTVDTILLRDGAAGTLAQRNSTNPQAFRVYNAFSTTSDFDRAYMRWSSNVLQIGTEIGGTYGTARPLALQTNGTTRFTLGATDGAATFTGSLTAGPATFNGASSTIASFQDISTGSIFTVNNSAATALLDVTDVTTGSLLQVVNSAGSTVLDVDAGIWSGTTVFTGLKYNATDTGSGGSLLMDLQVGGTSKFSVSKIGRLTVSAIDVSGSFGADGNWWSTNYLNIASTAALSFGSADLRLHRDAADALAQRRTTNAQAFRLYRTYTDGSNYERLALQTAANQVILAAETAGSGADDIDVTLTPVGTGRVRYGTHSAIGAETVTGYIEIKDAGGTIRKLAVVS